jgi:hypothetical protein
LGATSATPPEAEAADDATEVASVAEPALAPAPSDPSSEANTEEASVQSTASQGLPGRPDDGPPRKTSKFLTDITRAMQAAADSSRASTVEQFQTEAKTHIDAVRAGSADVAAELRKAADNDLVTIRERSKAELARIREETDRKIATRKSDLEAELQDYAARVERKIERVQVRVASFEREMERFFERLLNEDDLARFAAMAENLPEPPPFDSDDATDGEPWVATRTESAPWPGAVPPASVHASEADASPELAPEAPESKAPVPGGPVTEPAPQTAARRVTEPATEMATEPDQGQEVPFAVQDDRAAVEAAMAAIEAAYAAAEVETEPDADEAGASDPADPRLAALGLGPNLDAAEAEAAASAAANSDDEIPTIDDRALAARLAGLVPPVESSTPDSAAPTAPADAAKAGATSQVVVTGLVSVASIASFKRHIGRITGVQSVGVSSGPDGEFVFKVAHGGNVVLADAIPSLPGFEARVTGTGDGVVNVSARDPESEG